jgi:hypothetical protein
MKKSINWELNDSRYYWAEFSEDFKGSMERYLLNGYEPGGFTTAMLAHDMERALYNADTHNRTVFYAIAMWIRDRVPPKAQGSYEAVTAWCQDHDGRRTAFREQHDKERVWLTLVK